MTWLRRVLLAAVVAHCLACSGGPAPRILSWEIWDGLPDAPGSTRVLPQADGQIRLAKDRVYHARATVKTAAHGDRCIYRVFSYTWLVSLRFFSCTPETSETLVIEDAIPTWRADVERVQTHVVSVSLTEFDSESRTSTFDGPHESYPVSWIE